MSRRTKSGLTAEEERVMAAVFTAPGRWPRARAVAHVAKVDPATVRRIGARHEGELFTLRSIDNQTHITLTESGRLLIAAYAGRQET